jgi:hypothetical protein
VNERDEKVIESGRHLTLGPPEKETLLLELDERTATAIYAALSIFELVGQTPAVQMLMEHPVYGPPIHASLALLSGAETFKAASEASDETFRDGVREGRARLREVTNKIALWVMPLQEARAAAATPEVVVAAS